MSVKLFFEFLVMREKANYFYVKVFSEEVEGTLFITRGKNAKKKPEKPPYHYKLEENGSRNLFLCKILRLKKSSFMRYG